MWVAAENSDASVGVEEPGVIVALLLLELGVGETGDNSVGDPGGGVDGMSSSPCFTEP